MKERRDCGIEGGEWRGHRSLNDSVVVVKFWFELLDGTAVTWRIELAQFVGLEIGLCGPILFLYALDVY